MQNHQLRIVIVDDEPERSNEWAVLLQEKNFINASMLAFDKETSQAAIKAADGRRRSARGNQSPFGQGDNCEFDDADILIVDYDLQELVEAGQWSTGLWVAMLARAFT